ncbi:MAG: hypothetical protein J6M22_06360, partial [Firmicutes bacterium]|nr:hypothetical protein [Bacillota bacterium]
YKSVMLQGIKNNQTSEIIVDGADLLEDGVKNIMIDDSEKLYKVTFTNERVYEYWLSGDSYKMNHFTNPIVSWPVPITEIIQ